MRESLDRNNYLVFLDSSQPNNYIRANVITLNYSKSRIKFLKKLYYENFYIPFISYLKGNTKLVLFGNYPSLFWFRKQHVYFHNVEYLFFLPSLSKVIKTIIFFTFTSVKRPKIFSQSRYVHEKLQALGFKNIDVILYPHSDRINLFKNKSKKNIILIYPTGNYGYKNIDFLIKNNELFRQLNINLYITIKSNIKTSNIKFIGGLSHSDLSVLYGQVSGMIFTSKYESLGVPLIEACIHKLPLIAPQLDYVNSIVSNYYGFINDDSLSLKLALEKLKIDLINDSANIPSTRILTSPAIFIETIVS